MAIRKYLLIAGQSNAGPSPSASYANWIADRAELNLAFASTRTQGSYSDTFSMPGSFSGYGTLDIKGRALRGIRYLTFYNPTATGYSTYPGTGRVTAGSPSATVLRVEQEFTALAGTSGPPDTRVTIVRQLTGTSHTITAVAGGGSGYGSEITISPGFSPDPVTGEQFAYNIKATADALAGDSSVVITNDFGVNQDGNLGGCRL